MEFEVGTSFCLLLILVLHPLWLLMISANMEGVRIYIMFLCYICGIWPLFLCYLLITGNGILHILLSLYIVIWRLVVGRLNLVQLIKSIENFLNNQLLLVKMDWLKLWLVMADDHFEFRRTARWCSIKCAQVMFWLL